MYNQLGCLAVIDRTENEELRNNDYHLRAESNKLMKQEVKVEPGECHAYRVIT